jgi:hypothetical protein
MRELFALFAGETGWNPVDLFDVQSFVWVALEEKWDGEEDAQSAAPEPVVRDVEVLADGPYWFVGASFGRTNDQSDRFIAQGIWEIDSPSDRNRDQVLRMQPGDRIAIKATYVRKSGLPFDNQGDRHDHLECGRRRADIGRVEAGVRHPRMVSLHLSANDLGGVSYQ